MSSNRVYVRNLPYRTTWYELKDYMRTIGDVAHAKILTSHNGMSRGCGLVEFATAENAQHAIDKLDGTDLMGRTIFVRQDRAPLGATKRRSPAIGNGVISESGNAVSDGVAADAASPRDSSPAAAPESEDAEAASSPASKATAPQSSSSFTSPSSSSPHHPKDASQDHAGYALFVGNSPYSVNWSQLKQLFSGAGEVVRADVHLTMHRSSRGHGTVIFATESDAQNAIQVFNGYMLDGRPLEVREDKPAGERPVPFLWCSAYGDPSETVYIANLPWSTTDADLVELFESIGPSNRANLQTFPDGRPNGNGVVRYENTEDAKSAVEKLNKYNYGSRELQVTFARYPVRFI